MKVASIKNGKRDASSPRLRARSSATLMKAIKVCAGRIAEKFNPQRIILFGSHAYGKPTVDSDVDLVIVMPHRGRSTQVAIEIRACVNTPFSLDLLVYSPQELAQRYRIEDWFVRDIVEKGRVLYEASHP